MSGHRAAIAAAAIGGLILAACSSTEPAVRAPLVGLDRFYAQELSWGSCAPLAATDDDRLAFAAPVFDCARLDVPLDYAAPDATTARIAVLRQRASGERIGSLVMNPGGPGGSGVGLVASIGGRLADTAIGRRFDLIGFDPRGVGASLPAIDCITDAEWEIQRADLEQDEAENELYAQRCTQRSGGAAVLANVGTRDVVRDLDVLRAVLGDEKLTYLGFSYGTRIGALYAEAYPENVRALVLDGADDPSESTAASGEAQSAAFEAALTAYATDCARQPNCPLGTDPEQATAELDLLVEPLYDAPAIAENGTRTLSATDAYIAVDAALYTTDTWPDLTTGLTELATGDGTTLLALADAYHGRSPNGVYNNESEAFAAIVCVDEERDGRLTDIARGTMDMLGVGVQFDPCPFWPVPPTSRPHELSVEGLPATLVISTTGDPATPYQAGVELAKALKGRLLTVEGTVHGPSLNGNTCIDGIVATYLVDLTLPADGMRCVY